MEKSLTNPMKTIRTPNYATPLLKTQSTETFIYLYKSVNILCFFSNCEITTDWYVIKLVYVYIMTEEITDYIRETTFREECLLNVNFLFSFFSFFSLFVFDC